MREIDRTFYQREFATNKREPIIVAPELLVVDNESGEAREKMAIWHENYRSGQSTLVWDCSDARVFLPNPRRSVEINTVAATDEPRTYERMLREAPFKNVAIMTHLKCGAQGVKKAIQEGQTQEHEKPGIHRRVHTRLSTHDPIEQASFSAQHVSLHTEKPVFALVQNHETGEVMSVGAYLEGKQANSKELRNDLDRLLNESWGRRTQMIDADPNFFDNQIVQNPSTVLLTTDPQPVENRYPALFGNPNTVFKLLIPRLQDTSIPISGLRTAADHAEYPVINAIANYGTGKNFSETDTIFVETKNMEKSEQIAAYLLKRDFIGKFLELSNDHQIIIGETRQGRLVSVKKFI